METVTDVDRNGRRRADDRAEAPRRRRNAKNSTSSRICSTNRSSTSTDAKSCASTTSSWRTRADACGSSPPTSELRDCCAGSVYARSVNAGSRALERSALDDRLGFGRADSRGRIRRRFSFPSKQSRLARLHPSELAEIIGDLSAREALAVVGQLDDETAADAFEHLDTETRKSLIEDIGTERAADIIEEMDADDAADLLAELPEEQQSELLAEMDAYTAGELRELVKYPEDTAGGMMTTDYVWIYPHRTTEATIRKIREIAPVSEFIYYLYVLDKEDQSARCALTASAAARACRRRSSTASWRPIWSPSRPDTPAVDVASTIAKYDLLAVPVVDDAGKMLGIVTVDDAIDAIMPDEVAKKLPHLRRAIVRATA